MKLLHTADLHIGMTNYSKLDPQTGLESRLMDFFKTFDLMIDTAINEKVDAFIFAGDAYKTRDPSPTQQRGFGERIKKLAKNHIPVILVVGNHDTTNAEGKANTLDIYSALEIDNVFVSRKPELLEITTRSGLLKVISLPWLHKSDFKLLGDQILSMYGKIKASDTAIIAGHLEVEGSLFGSEKGLALVNDVTIPLSLLTDRKLSYVALGHIHKHQVLNQNPLVVYSGSPERIDFGEETEAKGFVLVDIPRPHQTTMKFIPTNARKFLSIAIKLVPEDQTPTQTILNTISKHQIENCIVRVSIDIPAEVNEEIEMAKIKKALSTAHFIAGISRNLQKSQRQKLEGDQEVERLTPFQALQKYFEGRNYNLEKIKQLEKYASELLEN